MIGGDRRREAAEEPREPAATGCICCAEEFHEELREIVAFDPDGSLGGAADSPADPIDRPTCKIIPAGELRTAHGKPITGINGHIPSCGHRAIGFEKPAYRPECGMRADE